MSDFPFDDIVTYWIPDFADGQADFTASIGIKADAAIANKRKEIITDKGKEPEVSRLAVYTDAEICAESFVAVGDFEGDPLDVDATDAARVLEVSTVPSGTVTRRVLI